MSFNQEDQKPQVVFPVQQHGWMRRNGIWFVPLMIILIGVPLLCFGSIFFAARMGMNLVLGPRDAAVAQMQDNQDVVAKMGEPISSRKNGDEER